MAMFFIVGLIWFVLLWIALVSESPGAMMSAAICMFLMGGGLQIPFAPVLALLPLGAAIDMYTRTRSPSTMLGAAACTFLFGSALQLPVVSWLAVLPLLAALSMYIRADSPGAMFGATICVFLMGVALQLPFVPLLALIPLGVAISKFIRRCNPLAPNSGSDANDSRSGESAIERTSHFDETGERRVDGVGL